MDTNLTLYSFDPQDTLERAIAKRWLDYLWQTAQGRLSRQILHKFYANAVCKAGVVPKEARETAMVFNQWQHGWHECNQVAKIMAADGSGPGYLL